MGGEEQEEFEDLAAEIMAALEDVPSPIALLDEDGIVRWQNKASLALRGRRAGSDFTAFLSAGDRPGARAVLRRVLAVSEPAELSVQVLNSESMFVTLRARWSAVKLHNGRKAVVVISMGDEPLLDERSVLTGPIGELTPRQLEVLRLLASGKTTKEIAQTLALSPTTVRNHIASLLAVLGVHSRLQAVVIARESGLLEP
jgi:DNA-binding CsgD family transcriptional regulator